MRVHLWQINNDRPAKKVTTILIPDKEIFRCGLLRHNGDYYAFAGFASEGGINFIMTGGVLSSEGYLHER